MSKFISLITFFSLLITINSNAANRYWITGVASNWNNTANWSTGSGGAGGASVPIAGDFVFFNANGLGNCTLDIAANFDGVNTTGYTGVIDLAGFSFNPAVSGAAACTFASGTINDTPSSSSVAFVSSGNMVFSGTVFSTPITITAGRVAFNGGVYNNPVVVIVNGASNVNGAGGCVFNSTLKVTTVGTNYFLMGITNPDIFNGDVTFINNGTSRIRVAYSTAGNQFNGNITVGSTVGTGVIPV